MTVDHSTGTAKYEINAHLESLRDKLTQAGFSVRLKQHHVKPPSLHCKTPVAQK